METFSALLGMCAGNKPVTNEIPLQRPVTTVLKFCHSFVDYHYRKVSHNKYDKIYISV